MKIIYLPENEYKALKLHWAGGHTPSKTCEKCNISRERYQELLGIGSKGDIIIIVDDREHTNSIRAFLY